MPYPRPSLASLQQQAQQDVLNSDITGLDAFLRFSILNVLCWVQAMLSWLHYGYLDYIAKQAVPWTATDEYLAGWGTLKEVTKEAAEAATSTAVSFTTSNTNAVIPAGTSVNRSDGWAYVTSADSTYAGGTVSAPIVSLTPGSAGNSPVGTIMALGTPVAGVQTQGTLTAAAIEGSDIETDDDFRTRVIAAYQASGQVGNAAQYINWATDVPGVTRAWVVPNGNGAGTVVVLIMLDETEAATQGFPVGTNGGATGETRIAPATGDQLTVANAIFPNQPVTALVSVMSPVVQPIAFTVADLGTGNTVANQAAITAALLDMFLRVSKPGGTINPNSWNEAIAAISSVTQFNVTQPAVPVTGATATSLPTLGNIVFSA